jgi:TonB family protein
MTRLVGLSIALLIPASALSWQGPAAAVLGVPVPSPAQVATLEQMVAASPDDIGLRTTILRNYAAAAPLNRDDYRAARLRHIQFVIEANPSSDLAASALVWVGSSGVPYSNAADHAYARSLWMNEVVRHFQDTAVVMNAIRFLSIEDKKQAEELFLRLLGERPAETQTGSYLGFFYAAGMVRVDTLDARLIAKTPDAERIAWAARSKQRLEESTNPRVLFGAATAIPVMAIRRFGGGPEYTALVKYADELGSRARKILKAAGQPDGFPPEMQMLDDEFRRGAQLTGLQEAGVPFTPNQINVASRVQSAKVKLAPPPNYPYVAMQGHVQGTVRLQVVIERDGTVQSVQPVSGNPILVGAAADAVKNWTYEPTVLNGTPVSVVTTVDVPFTLPPL